MLEENVILISQINDFVFCPISIYFHVVCGDLDKTLYQGIPQIQGRYAHQAIDKKTYSSKKIYCKVSMCILKNLTLEEK